ncbi:ABC transporter permease [Salipiger sp.]|uniref:ABC transporter permease n=1 Tax=Salipiger sp. TaxID=2078585 RepID=UPI003A980870
MTINADPAKDTPALFGLRSYLDGSLGNSRAFVLGALSLILVGVGWEASAIYGWVNPLFLPTMGEVGEAIVKIVSRDDFAHHLAVSGYEFGWGLGLSVLIGGILGILAGWFKPVEEFLQPIIIAVNSIPNLALIPLLILVFGIGTLPKIILVMLACIVVMVMNTAAGVQSADKQLMRMSRSFKANQFQLIRTVVIPSVVPYFMTGVRICVGKAVVSVAVAEIFGSTAGLGHILIIAQSSFNMPDMYAAVIILTAIGIALTQTAAVVERFFLRWRG